MKKTTLFMLIVFTITLQGQNKLLSSVSEYYDETSWIKSYGSNYEYDSNKNLITETSFSWDLSSNKWNYGWKEIYTYNPNNTATENISQTWNSTTNQFENSYKYSYTYNGNGKIVQILEYKANGANWDYSSKTDFTYSNNLISSAVSYTWYSNNAQWLNDYRSTVSYNSNSKISGILQEKWSNSQWVYDYNDMNTYNANNKLIAYTSDKWSGTAWIADYSENFNFDSNGNRISLFENYEGDLSKTDYIYDTSSLMSSYTHPFNDINGTYYLNEDFPYVNKILTEIHYNYNTLSSSYENNYRTTYNYDNPITLSTENFEINPAITVFPNPANNYIQIIGLTAAENYNVYSILGSEVKKGIINNNENIEIQNLTNGIYFLKFRNGNIKKFIKE